MLWVVAGVDAVVGEYISPTDALLTYLPQAHILEFMFENLCLFWGGTMGYGNPKTLSDTSVRNCNGDIREFKPTILVGVPAVWETVKKGIMNNLNKASFIVRGLFWGAMATKSFLLSTGLPGSSQRENRSTFLSKSRYRSRLARLPFCATSDIVSSIYYAFLQSIRDIKGVPEGHGMLL